MQVHLGDDTAVDVQVQVDRDHGIVHVLDNAPDGADQVTGSWEAIQARVCESLGLGKDPGAYRWFFYTADGDVLEYRDGERRPLGFIHPTLHPPFAKTARQRRTFFSC